MALNEDQNVDLEKSKIVMKEVALKDGKLISPINLEMGVMKPLYLDKLQWIYLDIAPSAVRVTNSGETVIISAKWAREVPQLANGPLEGNYVFSQIHFHWSFVEGGGSEHTVDGVSYPLEMHVVFFNNQYHSQEAALKKDDGILIVAYLVKLEETSTLGLEWLSGHLYKVIEPQRSIVLSSDLTLSKLIFPFTQDYVLYWGSMVSGSCSHTIQWLVSRKAFGISPEDLDKFRSLNCRKEPIIQSNIHSSSPDSGRTVFHVNPSTETDNVLLPEMFGASGQPQELIEIFKSNDYLKNPNFQKVENLKTVEELFQSKYYHPFAQSLKNSVKEDSDEWNTSIETFSFQTRDLNYCYFEQRKSKDVNHFRKHNKNRNDRTKKLTSKKERRQELEKNRLKITKKSEASIGEIMQKLGIKGIHENKSMCKRLLTEKIDQTCTTHHTSERDNGIQKSMMDTEMVDRNRSKENEDDNFKNMIYKEPKIAVSTKLSTQLLTEECDNANISGDLNQVIVEHISKSKLVTKSKLPRPLYHKNLNNLQSSYVKYFRPNKSSAEYKHPRIIEHLNTLETNKDTKLENLSPRYKLNQEQTKLFSQPSQTIIGTESPGLSDEPVDM